MGWRKQVPKEDIMRSDVGWRQAGIAKQIEQLTERLAEETTEDWTDTSSLSANPASLKIDLLHVDKAISYLAFLEHTPAEAQRMASLEQAVASLSSLVEVSAKNHEAIMHELAEIRRELTDLRQEAKQVNPSAGTHDAGAALDGFISVIRQARQAESRQSSSSLDDIDPDVLDLLFPEREDDGT